jgi:FMN phosphatase YigB (HAD superfamily)
MGLILYSMAELLPILRSVFPERPFSLVEIGSEAGVTTRELCAMLDAGALSALTIIEPEPSALLAELRGRPKVGVVARPSLEALPDLPLADLYLIDGDHNYFTVERETELIVGRAHTEGKTPILCYHDVAWPCGRRDLYYAPERIPAEHRQPHSYHLGVTLGTERLLPHGFRNFAGSAFATREGGPRNGVRTAIEDVLSRYPEWELHVVPAILGLGVALPRSHPDHSRIVQALEPFTKSALVASMEENRIALVLEYQRLEDEKEAASVPAKPSPARSPAPASPAPDWRADERWREIEAALAPVPRIAKAFSLDLDALDDGPLSPDELAREVAGRLCEEGQVVPPLGLEALARLRRAAEAEGARGGLPPDRWEVYQELAAVLRDPAAAAQREAEVELESFRPDPARLNFLRHVRRLGYRLVVLSRGPRTSAEARALLAKCGLDAEVDALFSVREGNWAPELAARIGLPPAEIVHLCRDAEELAAARQAGLVAYPLPAEHAFHRFLARRERLAVAGPEAARVAASLRTLLSGLPPNRRNINPLPPDHPFLVAPLLARFADWCVGELARAGVERAVVLDDVTAQLVEQAVAAAGVSLAVSLWRPAFSAIGLAALGALTPETVAPYLWTPGRAADLLAWLGIAPGEVGLTAEALAQPVTPPAVRQTLLRELTVGRGRAVALRRSADERAALIAELEPLLGDAETAAIVDLSFAGDLRRDLSRVLRMEGRRTELAGVYLCERSDAPRPDGPSFLDVIGAGDRLMAPLWRTPTDTSGGTSPPALHRARLRAGLLAFQRTWLAAKDAPRERFAMKPLSAPRSAPYGVADALMSRGHR